MDELLPEIYQFRVWLKGTSPMIWRCLLVNANTSIEDFHYMLQIIMNWTDSNLHQFVIYGKSYGIAYEGGMTFSDDPASLLLSDFQFYLNERFIYQYNFFVHWELEIRLEKKLTAEPNKFYPICIEGKRASPPEDCGGVLEFMKLLEHYNGAYILDAFCTFLKKYNSKKIKKSDLIGDLQFLNYWFYIYKFDCRAANKTLHKFATNDPDWAEYMEEEIHYENEDTDCD